MITPDFISSWLAYFLSLEDALVESDITEEEALYLLWKDGHIKPPQWVQDEIDNELQSREEEG